MIYASLGDLVGQAETNGEVDRYGGRSRRNQQAGGRRRELYGLSKVSMWEHCKMDYRVPVLQVRRLVAL